jgi:hypothetical protein
MALSATSTYTVAWYHSCNLTSGFVTFVVACPTVLSYLINIETTLYTSIYFRQKIHMQTTMEMANFVRLNGYMIRLVHTNVRNGFSGRSLPVTLSR